MNDYKNKSGSKPTFPTEHYQVVFSFLWDLGPVS